MYSPIIAADPITDAGRRILFYAGDDHDSKELFRDVVEGFGYAPVDLGDLRMGRLMQVDGPLTGLHAIREFVPHPVPKNNERRARHRRIAIRHLDYRPVPLLDQLLGAPPHGQPGAGHPGHVQR
jgi:hypothetical protein